MVRSKISLALLAVGAGLALPATLPASAGVPSDAPPIAQVNVRGSAVDWQPLIGGGGGLALTVSGPEGFWRRRTFKTGDTPTFSAYDAKGEALPDGDYTWELVELRAMGAPVTERPAPYRGKRRAARGAPAPRVQTGGFVLAGGIFSAGTGAAAESAEADAKVRPVTAADQVIADDLIVQGNACAGVGCVNGEIFTGEQLRVKGDTPKILFEDNTFPEGSPAIHDWTLFTGDAAGVERFSLKDVTANTTPLTVRGGAPNDSLYVAADGNVGLGTTTPAVDLHLLTDDVPSVRLEQLGGPPGTDHVWEVAADGSGFVVVDVTNGFKAPLWIHQNAPTESFSITSAGRIGMGTDLPATKAHVLEVANVNTVLTVENPHPGDTALGGLRSRSNVGMVSFQSHGSGRTLSRFGQVLGGWNEMLAVLGNGFVVGTLNATPLILGTNSTNRLEIGAAGGVTVNGNFTVTGGTKNFAVVDPEDDSRAIYYAALEGPEAGTYIRGAGRTEGGEATIVLPSYFSKVTEAEGVTVQLTAVGAWSRLYVAEQGAGRLVVRVADGDPDVAFNYQVQGVRKGYRDFEVERPNTLR